ncbi:MAG: hypothetical protein WD794_12465 [Mycobacteriales bacterium]
MSAPPGSTADTMLQVVDQGQLLAYTFQDLMSYHGPEAPGGVAHAFKVLERALPLLDPDGPVERREISVQTPFEGPGARDAFEMVTRAVSAGRYLVDPALARVERGPTVERYVFVLGYRNRAVTLVVRDGLVTDELVALARKADRSADEERHLTVLKQEMADRLLARPALEVYDVVE